MKILYAIQGTGNGHITVALEVLPHLKRRAEVDILISGCQVEVKLPYEIKYRLKGLGFVFGKKGGIDYLETYKKGKIKEFFQEIMALPVEEYDLVISDFEPVSAWACRLKNRTCIGFSHQAAVISKGSPRPRTKDPLGKAVLKYYAPSTAQYGFHYLPYDKDIFTPVIRQSIRTAQPRNKGYYTVYLPAYSDKRILKLLLHFPAVQWQVFSKNCTESYANQNIAVQPINNEHFVESMVHSEGVLCNAGFQTPAEALYLKKKLMVVPMKGQYEQQCNAAALAMMGVPVIKNIKRKHTAVVRDWIEQELRVQVDFPDETDWVVDEILENWYYNKAVPHMPKLSFSSASKFRNYLVQKIFYQLGSWL